MFFFFQAEDGIRDLYVTGVQTCALPIWGKWEIAKANLEKTETLLSYAKILAPFSGIISRRFVDPGAFIPAATSGSPAQNAALVTLTDFHRVRLQVAVPEVEASLVKTNQPVKFTVEGL